MCYLSQLPGENTARAACPSKKGSFTWHERDQYQTEFLFFLTIVHAHGTPRIFQTQYQPLPTQDTLLGEEKQLSRTQVLYDLDLNPLPDDLTTRT